ncbi:unnamed protein product [Rhizophagus irregularis]|uniref:Uncharacterized protein n=1 Tax=Rhizophagus irregularis TaxID=588596 RepID=A0A915YR48_9GLOM|nr:unnamed protein product [Rhizophagus irregularis]
MSADFLNELKTHRKLNCSQSTSLGFYGITKDPATEEFMMIMQYAENGKEVKAVFDEADKEIPNISALYEKDPDAIYTSRAFTFKNLSKPINSSFIVTTYLNEEDNEGCQDSQLVDLEISSSLKLKDDDVDN